MARRSYQNKKRFFPQQAYGDSGLALDCNKIWQDFTVYQRLKNKFITTGGRGQNSQRIQFQQLWWEPLIWTLSQLQWSIAHDDTAEIATRRATSTTYLELACAVDILTQGAFGPIWGNLQPENCVYPSGHQRDPPCC